VPEGDTIHRAVARLRPALEGQPLVRFTAPRWSGPTPARGETVETVRAVGKHLLVDFSGGLTLRTHLRMAGRWDLYRRDERWLRAPQAARVVIEVPAHVAVCFSAPDVSLTTRDRVATAHLGPDLCEPAPDLDAVVARARRLARATPAISISELLLDQRVASGIGNVYKSETLFIERIDPRTPVRAVDDETLRALFARAHQLLRANLGAGPRRTMPAGYAVYRRTRRPCRVCGTRVERIVLGNPPRGTYLCPHCQRASGFSPEAPG
jgi:endonuclease-8